MKAYIVEKEKLEHNLEILKEKAQGKLIWGVVKGNGYGLGAAPLAQFLAEHGVDHFAVTDLAEARAIRESGLTEAAILLIRGTCDPEELVQALDLNVILSVGSPEDLKALETVAAERETVAEAHLKIDTGMGRYGMDPLHFDRIFKAYRGYEHIHVAGIYTHFHTAGREKVTMEQYADFCKVLDFLKEHEVDPGMVHCCNSIAFWKYPQLHHDAVRLGSCLLGRVNYAAEAGLQRVGYVRADVEELKHLLTGHNVGYGSDCTLKRDTTIAVVGVGYLHGYSVERGYDIFRPKDCLRSMARYFKYLLKGRKLTVEVNGTPCPVLGHVGMVNIVVDVTDIPCQIRDEVIVQVNPLDLKAMEVRFE